MAADYLFWYFIRVIKNEYFRYLWKHFEKTARFKLFCKNLLCMYACVSKTCIYIKTHVRSIWQGFK